MADMVNHLVPIQKSFLSKLSCLLYFFIFPNVHEIVLMPFLVFMHLLYVIKSYNAMLYK
jgi:hypothetical protein